MEASELAAEVAALLEEVPSHLADPAALDRLRGEHARIAARLEEMAAR